MTDAELVIKRSALIETYVRELRDSADLSRLGEDVKERRFVEHTLQLAIQACLDIASHIVAAERLGEPQTNQELFSLLRNGAWIDKEQADNLRRMAGFRNVLVHGYARVDLAIVRDVFDNHLEALLDFVDAVRRRL